MTPLIDAAKAAGISYRQADHWCRSGYIRPAWRTTDKEGRSLPIDQGHSGHLRELPDLEVKVLATMARLIKAGLAHNQAAEAGRAIHPIGPGVQVLVTERESA